MLGTSWELQESKQEVVEARTGWGVGRLGEGGRRERRADGPCKQPGAQPDEGGDALAGHARPPSMGVRCKLLPALMFLLANLKLNHLKRTQKKIAGIPTTSSPSTSKGGGIENLDKGYALTQHGRWCFLFSRWACD